MTRELIQPNLHLTLVHFPIALLICGVVIELCSVLYRKSGLRAAGGWMILLGALASIPTTFSGMYALSNIVERNTPVEARGTWADTSTASPLTDAARVLLQRHAIVQAAATLAAVFLVMLWIGSSDSMRQRLHALLLVLMLGVIGAIGLGAWYAGEAVYVQGVGAGVMTSLNTPMPDAESSNKPKIEYLLPPEQVHVILAGVAIALAAVALGLAVRQISGSSSVQSMDATAPGDPVAMLRSLNPDAYLSQADSPPAARFWLLASLLAVLTAAAGAWLLASESSAFSRSKELGQSVFRVLWDMVRPDPGEKVNRRFAHVVTGTTIILVPVLLAIIARWASRRKGLLFLFSLLLFVAIVAQIWLGSLLLFDTDSGKITSFNPATPVVIKPGTQPASAPATVPIGK